MAIYDEHPIRTRRRCVYLSHQGRRCRRSATWGGSLSSNPELMSEWVYVEVCQSHAEKIFPGDSDVLAAAR